GDARCRPARRSRARTRPGARAARELRRVIMGPNKRSPNRSSAPLESSCSATGQCCPAVARSQLELTARTEDDAVVADRELPPLYDPRFEHDACGVGVVVDVKGRKSHAIVDEALTAVCGLNHRGGAGAEPDTGDGAGILVQTPDSFYRATVGFDLPPAGAYATGIAFVPVDRVDATTDAVAKVLADEGFAVLGWRAVPVDTDQPGASARELMPAFV